MGLEMPWEMITLLEVIIRQALCFSGVSIFQNLNKLLGDLHPVKCKVRIMGP